MKTVHNIGRRCAAILEACGIKPVGLSYAETARIINLCTRSRERGSVSVFVLMVLAMALFLVAAIVMPFVLGIGSLGPTRVHEATVNRLYVDTATGKDGGSHYMVGTTAGVFEVENGFLLGVWNADEIYSALQQGKKYRLTTEGNRVVNAFYQEYPCITRVELIEPEAKP